MHSSEAERVCVCCLVVFGAGPGQRSSKHWMSSSELSESQAVITPRSPTHSRQLTTPVTPERHACVCVWLEGRKGGVDWGETKWKTRAICASSSCASCVAAKRMWAARRALTLRVWAKAVDVCVAEEKRRVLFSSSLSSSLSSFYLSVLQYIPPLYFPFLHAAPDVKAVKY